MKTLNLIILLFVLATINVSGQAIQLIGQSAYVNNHASADHNIPNWGAVIDSCSSTGLISGTVNDFVLLCNASATKDAGWTFSKAQGFTYATINGNNSPEVSFQWKHVSRSSCGMDLSYIAHSEDTMAIDLLFTIAPTAGTAVGDSIIVYYKYSVFGSGQTQHEGNNEDPVYSNNFFNLNGDDQLNNTFNFFDPPGLSGYNRLDDIMGEIHTVVGADFSLDIQSQINTHITNPANQDLSVGRYEGSITFNLIPFTDMSLVCNSFLFSVDIGSDSELSDPYMDGDEVFDPGDAYVLGSNFIPSSGANGVINDILIFGSDPNPVPGNPLSAVPIGTGLPVGTYWDNYFDLDGIDNLSFSLAAIPNNYGQNLPSLNVPTSNNLHFASHFIISYDDDGAPNFTDINGNVPVNSLSPITASTFGTTNGQDEIVAVDLFPFAPSAYSTNGILANENMIHYNFNPCPDIIEATDDDIDALDYVNYVADTTNPGNYYYNGPQFYYWSPDHEAPYFSTIITGPLNAGSVYETDLSSNPGFVEVVNAQTHLGLAAGTDVDAFEFGMVWHNQFQRFGLALLFSVDTDDPLTVGIDESGSLDPSKIYASFLDGQHFDFSASPLYDDIDAITLAPTSFVLPGTQLSADFTGTPTTCNVGDVVSFMDISTGNPTTWSWDFDFDGNSDSNIQNPTTSYNLAGIYTVSLTIGNLSGTTTVTKISYITVLANNLVVNAGIDATICPGQLLPLSSSVSGGVSPYTYSWTPGSTLTDPTILSPIAMPLATTTYTLTVIDAVGTTATDAVTVFVNSAIIISNIATNVSCAGGTDGSITTSVSGGTSPFSYLWTNGATSPDIGNLSAGTYSLTVTDATGCNSLAIIIITEPTPLSISITDTDASCYGAADGSLTVTISGGIPPYNFIWDDGATTQNRSGLSGGTYSVTVYDFQQCSSIGSAIVMEPAVLTVTLSGTDATANGVSDGYIVTTVAGGTTTYSFLWSNSATTQNISNLATGWYTITVTDANSCSTTSSIYINEPALNNPFQGWYFNQTGTNHSILIAGTTPILIDGVAVQNGSFLGVFYDSLGHEACAGFVEFQSTSTAIAAWGDDTQTSAIDGFSSGEEFIWKVWDASTGIEYEAEATYDVLFPNQEEYFANGLSSLISLTILTSDTQDVTLNQTWNLASTYIDPFEGSIDSIFAPIVSDILIVKDCSGSVYWPAWNLNMIGSWNVTEAYLLYALVNTSVDFIGDQVDPSTTPISLSSGWNCISYLNDAPASIVTQLASIVSDIIIVKDGNGLVYWPAFNVDMIGNMTPGQGYMICMSSPTTFIYPPAILASTKSDITNNNNKFYNNNINTGINMTLCIPLSSWEYLPETGDEIAIFNDDNTISGTGIFANNHLVITIWGDDETTAEIDGMFPGEPLKLRLWNKKTGEHEIKITEWVEGSGNYNDNEINIASKVTINSSNNIELSQNIPNPASVSTKITFKLPSDCDIELGLYNILGEKIGEIANGFYPGGEHTIQIDISNYSQGTYFYKLISSDYTITKTMLINK